MKQTEDNCCEIMHTYTTKNQKQQQKRHRFTIMIQQDNLYKCKNL